MMRSAKRRRALLESNPLRNNRRELIAWPGREVREQGLFRPAFLSEPRNRFPDALKTQGLRGVVGATAGMPPPSVKDANRMPPAAIIDVGRPRQYLGLRLGQELQRCQPRTHCATLRLREAPG